MNITTVSYGKTFNLGDYESVRIDMTAELSDEDTPEGVLATLRELVCGSSGVAAAPVPSAVVSDSPHYGLYNSVGSLVKTFDTAFEWLKTYEYAAGCAQDVKAFVTNNQAVFNKVKGEAKANPNPRPLTMVQEVEYRVGEMCK